MAQISSKLRFDPSKILRISFPSDSTCQFWPKPSQNMFFERFCLNFPMFFIFSSLPVPFGAFGPSVVVVVGGLAEGLRIRRPRRVRRALIFCLMKMH